MPAISPIQYSDQNGDKYTLSGAGLMLVSVVIELDPRRVSYFRKNTAVWDLLAFIGGFSVALMFVGKLLYNFCGMNNSNRLV